jgi:hypothetical protein
VSRWGGLWFGCGWSPRACVMEAWSSVAV